MADLTIHELQNEAITPANDDYTVLDGATAGTRKITPANLATWILGKISSLATTVTSFASEDFIAVSNTTIGARKMSKDTLLELTAQNALAGNVAPAFDPTRTSYDPYIVNEIVSYEGKTYIFVNEHYGVWNASDVREFSLSEYAVDAYDRIVSEQKLYCIGKNNATSTKFIYIGKGASVKVKLDATTWDKSGITLGDDYYDLAIFISDGVNNTVKVAHYVSSATPLSSEYTIYTTDEKPFILLSVRATAGVAVGFKIGLNILTRVEALESYESGESRRNWLAGCKTPYELGAYSDMGSITASSGAINRNVSTDRAIFGYLHLGKGSIIDIDLTDTTAKCLSYAVMMYDDSTGEYDSTLGNVGSNTSPLTVTKDSLCLIYVKTSHADVSTHLDDIEKAVRIRNVAPNLKYESCPSVIEAGNLEANFGNPDDNYLTIRMRTRDFMLMGKGSTIVLRDSRQRYVIFLYGKDKCVFKTIPDSLWRNLPAYQLEEDAYVKFYALSDEAGVTLTPADVHFEVVIRPANDFTIPSYYFTGDYIANKIASINAHDSDCGFNGDSFVFITDTHWASNMKRSPALIDYIKSKTCVRDVVFGGDATTKYTSKDLLKAAYDEYREVMKDCREYGWRPIIGNHEFNNPGADPSKLPITLSASEAYALVYGENTPITHVIDEYSGYWDNEVAKIRYIYVGCSYTSTIPSSVADNVVDALDELPTGYKVMVLSHVGLDTNTPAAIDSTLQPIIDKLDAMQVDNKVIGVLTGHRHFDGYIRTAAGTIVIATTCDAMIENPNGLTRTRRTTTEQAFDVVQIDMTNEKIYLTRIGAGSDREFGFQSDE